MVTRFVWLPFLFFLYGKSVAGHRVLTGCSKSVSRNTFTGKSRGAPSINAVSLCYCVCSLLVERGTCGTWCWCFVMEMKVCCQHLTEKELFTSSIWLVIKRWVLFNILLSFTDSSLYGSLVLICYSFSFEFYINSGFVGKLDIVRFLKLRNFWWGFLVSYRRLLCPRS